MLWCVWLRPLKKRGKGVASEVPQIIAKFDGGGSDAYWALRRMVDLDPVPEVERASTLLFRRQMVGGGFAHITIQHMRWAIRKRMRGWAIRKRMRGLGYEFPNHWGAHSCWIGEARI